MERNKGGEKHQRINVESITDGSITESQAPDQRLYTFMLFKHEPIICSGFNLIKPSCFSFLFEVKLIPGEFYSSINCWIKMD